MLDLAHPIVMDIWNFFPMQYVFPFFIRIIGNFALFLPNILLRPLWLVWNGVMTIPNVILLVATSLLNY